MQNILWNCLLNSKNENRTYESLCNLININKDDYTVKDMNEIINESDICNKFNNIFKIKTIAKLYIMEMNMN